MYNIAVTMSGLPTYLDINQEFFYKWNSIFSGKIKFHFYGAFWLGYNQLTSYPVHSDYFFDKTKSLYLNKEIEKVLEKRWTTYLEPMWCYAFDESQKVRKKSSIDFDGVIHTYTDCVILKDHLNSILYLLENGYDENAIYSIEGSGKKKWNGYKNHIMGLISPKFKFGSVNAFDRYSNFWQDIILDNSIPLLEKVFHRIHWLNIKKNKLKSLDLLKKPNIKYRNDEKVLPIRTYYEDDHFLTKQRHLKAIKEISQNEYWHSSIENVVKFLSNPIYK